jgi:hypothetical protein
MLSVIAYPFPTSMQEKIIANHLRKTGAAPPAFVNPNSVQNISELIRNYWNVI